MLKIDFFEKITRNYLDCIINNGKVAFNSRKKIFYIEYQSFVHSMLVRPIFSIHPVISVKSEKIYQWIRRDKIPSFFFLASTSNDHLITRLETVPPKSPRNIWGVDHRPNGTSANE